MGSKGTAMLFNLASIICFLLFLSIADGRLFASSKVKSSPVCESVYGAQSGDTCFAVTQLFNLTTDFFDGINPNLDCDNLFVGQWLCVDGSF